MKLSLLSSAQPQIGPLALLHGLHQATLAGFEANFGALNVTDTFRARYWFDTHSKGRVVTGIIVRFREQDRNYSMAHIFSTSWGRRRKISI